MAAALDLITDALIELGVVAVGEAVSAEDANLGLSALNSMIDGWNTQNLTIYSSYDATFTLVPGQATYTVGPSGNWNGARPVSLISQYVRYNGIDYPVQQVDQETYNLIAIKTQPGILPEVVNFNTGYPLATMTLWPVPNTALSFTFSSNALLAQPATLQTVLSLPPGYYRAMRLNLAVELAGRYGRQLSPVTLRMASTALGDVRRLNKRTPLSRFDDAILTSGSSYTRIIAGY